MLHEGMPVLHILVSTDLEYTRLIPRADPSEKVQNKYLYNFQEV